MAEETQPAAAPVDPSQIESRVLAQYIRDMSFENILAQKGVGGEAQPEINVQVNLDARKRSSNSAFRPDTGSPLERRASLSSATVMASSSAEPTVPPHSSTT